jgi:hypothetical protein
MDPPTAPKNDNVDDKATAEMLELGVAPVEFRPSGKGRPAHYVEIDPAAEKKLLLKLDLILLPIVTLCNLFSFIDRANIGNARVAGKFVNASDPAGLC